MLCRALRPGARYQILGPHGSGKTTLLRQLERAARAAGLVVVSLRGSRACVRDLVPASRADLVLLDEVEELGLLGRLGWFSFRQGLAARQMLGTRGPGLVISAHRDFGLETLARRSVSPELALQVVTALLSGSEWQPPSRAEIARRLERHQGNLREVLFELYDAVERGTLDRVDRADRVEGVGRVEGRSLTLPSARPGSALDRRP